MVEWADAKSRAREWIRRQEAQKAMEARKALEDAAFVRAVENAEDRLFGIMLDTGSSDSEILRARRDYLLLQELVRNLESEIITGRMAEKELTRA